MNKLFCHLHPYAREAVLAPLFKMLEAGFDLAVPLVIASIIDRGIVLGDAAHIGWMAALLVLLALVGFAAAATAQYFAARAAVGFSARLRRALMEKIQSLGYAELDALGESTLLTRMTSDATQVQNGLNMALRLLMRSPFVVFGALAMAFAIDGKSGLLFAGAIGLLLILVFALLLLCIPMNRRTQRQLDEVTCAARENLAGVRVLRAFGKEEAEAARFERLGRALMALQLRAGRVSVSLGPLTTIVINLAVVLLLSGGAVRVSQGTLTTGQIVALYNYLGQILVELVKMANLIILLTRAWACGDRIQQTLSLRPAQRDGDQPPTALQGAVEMQGVSFTYPGAAAPALEGISFLARAGETIGVIGGTGSGKTTLMNLIPRFYDAAGAVRIDGQDVKALPLHALRAQIGVVPQRAQLFSGTIRENLCWGGEDDDAALWQALAAAQAEGFVREKSEGLSARVEQGGRNFSGGQRQRLCIARALVRRPRILILDDAASALDYATEAALRRAISALPFAPTTFIVSQRTTSVRFADRILVLSEGRLVGNGKHEALLDSCPIYREIHESQVGGEEEAHA